MRAVTNDDTGSPGLLARESVAGWRVRQQRSIRRPPAAVYTMNGIDILCDAAGSDMLNSLYSPPEVPKSRPNIHLSSSGSAS
ncbi:hypothetical protein CH063_10736 [Colletotrichum higginsianum]|uniref:Uncharacterized protein n=1 Tax=Colletotrichum higginsianum (strain IMI 349063) TaxID=759273 RepID=H1VIL7_COLHI|nr:hypothetical protein CH063_10736 [Colletotrichum higginsianum]